MGKRRCKTCGNLYDPKGPGDMYCSELCRTAGCFIGGGGDTTKPNSEIKTKIRVVHKAVKTAGKEFPRVMEMLELPLQERWRIAKDFTEDEMAYCRKLAKKSLNEDRIASCISEWDEGEDEENIQEADSQVGESDDGSV